MSRKRPLNSAVVIAQLLDCEGFTSHTAQQVKRYWMRNAGLTKRQQHQIVGLKCKLSELCGKLDEGDKLVLGRFIGLQKKLSFDTGLRIGLTALAVQNPVLTEEMEAPV